MAIALLDTLEVLDLRGNGLSGALPPETAALAPALTRLLLLCSGVCGKLPGALNELPLFDALGFTPFLCKNHSAFLGCFSWDYDYAVLSVAGSYSELTNEFLPPCNRSCTLRRVAASDAAYGSLWYCGVPATRWAFVFLLMQSLFFMSFCACLGSAPEEYFDVMCFSGTVRIVMLAGKEPIVKLAAAGLVRCCAPQVADALLLDAHASAAENKLMRRVAEDACREAMADAAGVREDESAQLLANQTFTDGSQPFIATDSGWDETIIGAESETAMALSCWRVEMERMRKLRIAHPHIAQLLCEPDTDCVAAMRWAVPRRSGVVLGTLAEALAQRSFPLPMRDMIRLAHEAATGLAYLHHAGIVHARLRAASTLLCGANCPSLRLAYFGAGAVNSGGSWPWLAPEQLASSPPACTQMSDQYALGVLMWEIFHRSSNPYPDFATGAQDCCSAVANGRRPRIKGSLPPEIAAVMIGCWRNKAAERFTAARVACTLDRLRGAQAALEKLDADARNETRNRSAATIAGASPAGVEDSIELQAISSQVDDEAISSSQVDDDATSTLECPRHGISLAALRAFVDDRRGTYVPSDVEIAVWEAAGSPGVLPTPALFESLTTAQVVSHVIKPLTVVNENSGCSYVELLLAADANSGGAALFAADATVFVSHAWSNNFVAMAEAVLDALEGKADSNRVYLWNDIFVVNQHRANDLQQAWWVNSFAKAVAIIGRTLLVADPYAEPEPLKRSWCLWEIYSTLEGTDSGEVDGAGRVDSALNWAGLRVALPPAQVEAFDADLAHNLDAVRAAVERIDVRRATAFKPTDQAHIHNTIAASSGGFVLVNSRIRERLIGWLLRKADDTLQAELSASAQGDTSVDPLRLCRIGHLSANWLDLQGESVTARRVSEDMLRASKLPAAKRLLSTGSALDIISFRHHRALALRRLQRHADAVCEYRACVRTARVALGYYLDTSLVQKLTREMNDFYFWARKHEPLLFALEMPGNPIRPLARRVLRPSYGDFVEERGRFYPRIPLLLNPVRSTQLLLAWLLFLPFYAWGRLLDTLSRWLAQRPVLSAPAARPLESHVLQNTSWRPPLQHQAVPHDFNEVTPGLLALERARGITHGRCTWEQALNVMNTDWDTHLSPELLGEHYAEVICLAMDVGDALSRLGRRASLLSSQRLFIGTWRLLLPGATPAGQRLASLKTSEAVLRPTLHACRNLLGAMHPRSVECAFLLALALRRRSLACGEDECALEAASLAHGTVVVLAAALGAEHPRTIKAVLRARDVEYLHTNETLFRATRILWATLFYVTLYAWMTVMVWHDFLGTRSPAPSALGVYGGSAGDELLLRLTNVGQRFDACSQGAHTNAASQRFAPSR